MGLELIIPRKGTETLAKIAVASTSSAY